MLQGLEDVETYMEVIAILLIAAHEKKKNYQKIKNTNIEQHSF